MTLDQSRLPLRGPKWGWEREGLGLTRLAGGPRAQALHVAVCGQSSPRVFWELTLLTGMGGVLLSVQDAGARVRWPSLVSLPWLGHEPELR